jgi:hypothetical protein
MKAVPTRACHAMSNRAERGIRLAVVLKAVCQDCYPNDLPLVDALENCTGGRQSGIPVRRFTMTLDLAPEAARRSQSQIRIVHQVGSTPACPLAQLPFGFRLQAPGDPPKQMRSIERGRCFSEYIAISCSELSRFQLPESLDFHPQCIVHSSLFLSEVFTPESMDAPFGPQSKRVLLDLHTSPRWTSEAMISVHPGCGRTPSLSDMSSPASYVGVNSSHSSDSCSGCTPASSPVCCSELRGG